MRNIARIISALLVAATLCLTSTVAFAAGEIEVYANSQKLEFDVPPMIIDGRTMVPVRVIFEALGAEVNWHHDTRTVVAERGGLTIKLIINDNAIYVGEERKELDVPATIIDNRTLVPARAVSEAFGAKVEWDAQKRHVIITDDYKPNKVDINTFVFLVNASLEGMITTEMGVSAKFEAKENNLVLNVDFLEDFYNDIQNEVKQEGFSDIKDVFDEYSKEILEESNFQSIVVTIRELGDIGADKLIVNFRTPDGETLSTISYDI